MHSGSIVYVSTCFKKKSMKIFHMFDIIFKRFEELNEITGQPSNICMYVYIFSVNIMKN